MGVDKIIIKTYQAGKGDAFLVSFGEKKEYNIMIDMGISSTYDKIKPDLESLKSNGKKLDLLVITHMHEDHIGGAIKFINDNGVEQNIIEVDEVWHNSYRHLLFNKNDKSDNHKNKVIQILKNYIERQENKFFTTNEIEKISVRQGSIFSKSLYDFNYAWNSLFNKQAVVLDLDIPVVLQVNEDINIILLSPSKSKLNELSSEWLTWLKKKRIKYTGNEEEFEYAFEFLMMQENVEKFHIEKTSSSNKIDFEKLSKEGENIADTTATNGTSIAFIIEYKNKKLLFLGDAHEDIICTSLDKLQKYSYVLDFDLVKISHHGSIENISNSLLSLIKAKKFLISTNGKGYGHPSLVTLAKIIMAQREIKKEIIFNYPLEIISKLKPFMDDYNYEVKYLEEITLC